MTGPATIQADFADAAPDARAATPLRMTFWGTYDLSKPRTRILLDGLRQQPLQIAEVHAQIWPEHADKSQMGARALAFALLWALLSYPGLIFQLFRSPRNAVLVVPYLGPLDVLVLWPFAKLRGQRIVWDMFLSLYDTVVNDRKMISPRNPAAWLLYATEGLAARVADTVLLDTQAHADYITGLYDLPDRKTAAIPVGAETDKFPRLSRPEAGSPQTRVLFYGQLIPLHGVETILEAARLPRGQAHQWHIIGTGQDRAKVEKALDGQGMSHVTWQSWVDYDALIHAIEASQICLGIFGTSEKAASVVPNKVYQTLCAGRPVITRSSPAMDETFAAHDALLLVPAADPTAILDAIDTHIANGLPTMPPDQLNVARSDVIAARLVELLRSSVPKKGVNP